MKKRSKEHNSPKRGYAKHRKGKKQLKKKNQVVQPQVGEGPRGKGKKEK